jgi:hypothetical protein
MMIQKTMVEDEIEYTECLRSYLLLMMMKLYKSNYRGIQYSPHFLKHSVLAPVSSKKILIKCHSNINLLRSDSTEQK